MDRSELNAQLPSLVDAVVKSIGSEPRLQHLNRVYLPNRDAIIESIEKLRQCLFVGYFGAQGDMDQAITIRTLVFHGDEYSYQAGGGIVADSIPAAEHDEVLAKSAALRGALKLAEEGL